MVLLSELILVSVSGGESFVKSLVHVEVLPLFGAGQRVALIAIRLDLSFEHISIDRVINVIRQVTLGEDQQDGLAVFDLLDLVAPFSNVFEG